MRLQRVDFPTPFAPIRAILSPWLNFRVKFLNIFLSGSYPKVTFSKTKISFPIGLFILKTILGSLLLEGFNSSILSFSNCFCLDVACFALEALAENLLMKDSNSSFSFSFLFLSNSFCLAIRVEAIYQSL